MNYRALIFEDDKSLRQLLWFFFDSRGYEILTFPHPGLCPISEENTCPCPNGEICSDIIISDVAMPCIDGFEFVDGQIRKGCRCKHIALISGAFTQERYDKAKDLGLTLFEKPFRLAEIKKWLEHVEKDIDPQRRLAHWFLKYVQHSREMP